MPSITKLRSIDITKQCFSSTLFFTKHDDDEKCKPSKCINYMCTNFIIIKNAEA